MDWGRFALKPWQRFILTLTLQTSVKLEIELIMDKNFFSWAH
jgi:hypothetical protein